MLACDALCRRLADAGFAWFAGVPDSTLGGFVDFLCDAKAPGAAERTHRMVASERDAIAWAAGHHLATGRAGVVYLQNSGLGNAVNPLTSLADPAVYRIPMLLLIGWRGEPGGAPDEPQHERMGAITRPLLDVLGIAHAVLPDDEAAAAEAIRDMRRRMDAAGGPAALIVRHGSIAPHKSAKPNADRPLSREQAIETIVRALAPADLVVATTGKASRELFELRERDGAGHQNDFLMVGSLGLASPIGAELALARPERRVIVIDGDSALLMAAGALATVGFYAPRNLYHFVLDNGASDSTGGQPTVSATVDFPALAKACGYVAARAVATREQLEDVAAAELRERGPRLIAVAVRTGSRKDLGRPTVAPQENKAALMEFLGVHGER